MADGLNYYTQPSNIMPGLQMLGQGVQRRRATAQEEEKKERESQIRSGLAQVMKTNDPDAIADYVIRNPGAQKIAMQSMGLESDIEIMNAIRDVERVVIEGEDPATVATESAQRKLQAGGDATREIETAEEAVKNKELSKKKALMALSAWAPERYRSFMSSISGEKSDTLDVAGIKEFEYLTEGLQPKELEKAKRIKLGLSPRATESAVEKASKSFAVESGKLEARYKLSPKVSGAVTAAKNEAAATVKEAGDARSNKKAWNVYNNSMTNLSKAMEGTVTGPFMGFIPAVTTNQQIAKGAVAVMAPVLKQMFRASGEGTFTDSDQKMLMGMVPSRTDRPKAITAKIKAIDDIVRAKLGIEQYTTEQQQQSTQAPNVQTKEQYDTLPSGSTYRYNGKTYRKK